MEQPKRNPKTTCQTSGLRRRENPYTRKIQIEAEESPEGGM